MEPRDRARISSLRPNFPALVVLFVLWLIWAPFLDGLFSAIRFALSISLYPLLIFGGFCVIVMFGFALALLPLLLGGGIPRLR